MSIELHPCPKRDRLVPDPAHVLPRPGVEPELEHKVGLTTNDCINLAIQYNYIVAECHPIESVQLCEGP